MLRKTSTAACLVALAFVACEPDEEPQACSTDADCGEDTPLCSAETAACEALPAGHPIGWRDGAADSVDFTLILELDTPTRLTDLAFNPTKPDELWVLDARDDSVTIITRPGESDMTSERKRDPAASHFMDNPPAFAFGSVIDPWGQTFGICGDSNNGGNEFMGPALFSADPEIFALDTPEGLGSHLDMLHSTSYCRGIAWAEASVFYTFNSKLGTIDKYDFVKDHGPGNDDHSDGKIWRYVEPTVTGVDGVPSHVIYDPVSTKLYIADTGTGRVLFLDTASGAEGNSFSGDEPVRRRYIEGATFGEVVPPGTLTAPSGLELHDGLLYVTDATDSRFYAFDLDGNVVRTLETGGAPGTLAGMTFGPDGKVYFVDSVSSRVYRIDPK